MSVIVMIALFAGTVFSQQVAPEVHAQTAPSPTGHTPKLFWTPERQAVWNRMWTDYQANPINYQTYLSNPSIAKNDAEWLVSYYLYQASFEGSGCRDYFGQWSALLYQMTGDTQWATRAWNSIKDCVYSKTPAWQGLGGAMWDTMRTVVIYDWIGHTLSAADRQAFVAYLHDYGNKFLTDGTYKIRTGDSDQVVGQYFGLAFIDQVAPPNPLFLSRSWVDAQNTTRPVGGLTATGANMDSLRNELRLYVEKNGGGGEFIESSEYNLLTNQLLIMGVEGIRTARKAVGDNTDYFPEITSWLPDAAAMLILSHTPNMLDTYQWGDVEKIRTLFVLHRLTLSGMLAGQLQGTSVGPNIQKLTQNLFQYEGECCDWNRKPYPMFGYFYNPYATSTDWRGSLMAKYAPGQGMLYHHDGWGANDAFFGAHITTKKTDDHMPQYFGDFQLWRNGEWALSHPIGWGSGNERRINGEAHNAMRIGGLSYFREARGQLAQEFGPNNSYAYVAGATGGRFYDETYWAPPPPYVNEWTRSLFYLPGKDKKSSTVIAFDRVNAEDPKTFKDDRGTPNTDDDLGFSRYSPNAFQEQYAINDAQARKEWVIHPRIDTAPTINNATDTVSWQTAKQKMRLNMLLPDKSNRKFASINEDSLYGWTNDNQMMKNSEKKWQVRVMPATDQKWDTFLNVFQAYNSDVTDSSLTNTLVQNSDKSAQGVVVKRAGHDDTVVIFNGKQGPDLPWTPLDGGGRLLHNPNLLNLINQNRLHKTSFSINFSASTSQSQVYFTDLDPTKTWTVTDNGAARTMTVSSQGLGQLSLSGTGSHNLVVSTEGAPVIPKAMIQLSKTVDRATAQPGDTLTYTLAYTNSGDANATNVRITDPIPTGTTYVTDSASNGGTLSGTTLTWNIGTVAKGAAGTVTFQVTIDQPQDPPPNGDIDLYVSATGSDTYNCTQATPCREIRKALTLVQPGQTIGVADGQYQGFDVRSLNGTATAPITIKATGSNVEILKTTDRSDNRDTIYIAGSSYIVIDGLRTFGANRAGIRVDTSPHVTIQNSVFGDNQTWGIFTNHSEDLTILNNEAYGSKAEHGIYVADFSHRALVKGNKVHDNFFNGIQINSGEKTNGATLEANHIYNNGAKGFSIISADNVVMQNNLVYNNATRNIGAAGIHLAAEPATGVPSNNNVIVNNTIVEPRMAGVRITDNSKTNTIFNNLIVSASGIADEVGGNSIDSASNIIRSASTGLFANAASNDYHLVSGSAALDTAKTSFNSKNAPTVDFEGTTRPQGTAADAGADELNVTTGGGGGGTNGPLKLSDNKRYLVKQDGAPFFWLGDTAWKLFQRLTREEADQYLQDRANKGFTVIQTVVPELHRNLTVTNVYGHPVADGGDPAKPNEQYFQHVDYVVNKAESLGMYVGMLPVWGNHVRYEPMNTVASAKAWGKFLGTRYKDKPIIWILGGDDIVDDTLHARWQAMAEGLAEGDGGRNLITFHTAGGNSSSTWFHNDTWMHFNMYQTGHYENSEFSVRGPTTDYGKTPVKPTIDGEPGYENIPAFDSGRRFTDYDTRKFAYWSVFSGAFGHTYGANDVWQFYNAAKWPTEFGGNTPWQQALNFAGADDMQHLKKLVLSRPFLTRIPDQSVITSSEGSGTNRVRSTRDNNGTYAFVYTAGGQAVTVDMTKITGSTVKASWYNPREGTITAIGSFANTGTRQFTPPSSGEGNDWVLVLDDASKNYANP